MFDGSLPSLIASSEGKSIRQAGIQLNHWLFHEANGKIYMYYLLFLTIGMLLGQP